MGNFDLQQYVNINFDKWETADYMAAACLCCNLLIFTPIISIYCYKYAKRRNKSKYIKYFQTRNMSLIKGWMFVNFYYISIHVILLCIIQFYFRDEEWRDYFSDFAVISLIFCLFVLRYWKLYFDYMWSMSQLDLIWKRQINEGYSNWFLSHRKFGNAKFCFLAILLPFYILLNASL